MNFFLEIQSKINLRIFRLVFICCMVFTLGWLKFPLIHKYQKRIVNIGIFSNYSKIHLNDICITVRTSGQNEQKVSLIVNTWFKLASKQIWFITDSDSKNLRKLTNGHLVPTECGATQEKTDLNCKLGVEFETCFDRYNEFWCHFDDDNYVNIENLLNLLNQFNVSKDWYLGKFKQKDPFIIFVPNNYYFNHHYKLEVDLLERIHFGLGGAGFCVSRSLASKIRPLIYENIMNVYENGKWPDDVLFGAIVQFYGGNLTEVPLFHSNRENLSLINPGTFKDQISFGYKDNNTISINRTVKKDPTGFLSLHCMLFRNSKFC